VQPFDFDAIAGRPVVVLTGAGISAESGIPTFRGKEGYWTVGSRVYHPQELATHDAFQRMPESVWQWYLYRRTVCRDAAPNAAHLALVDLERRLGDRFRLLTQNVDGLHIRAGSSLARTYQIHGNIDFMRCAADCCLDAWPVPDGVGRVDRDTALTPALLALLRCPRCNGLTRPHVLWFDECYDEPRYRFASSLAAAEQAGLLITVGSTATTNLPVQVVEAAAAAGAALIDVNIDDNPFADAAGQVENGWAVRGPAARELPTIVARIR
jgi:NAD-dependent deacetylase